MATTCNAAPSLCGEIGAGWFMFALRDAAAQAGHYQSPAKASAFFGQIADEISAACARGDLECSPQLIAAMPPVSWRRIAELLPSRLSRAYHLLMLSDPPLQFNLSSGTQDQLDADLRFLNYPPHTRLSQIPPASAIYTLSGWYYKSGHEWISVEVRGADGSLADVQIDRNPSADLQQVFNDSAASRQRFVIRTHCNDDCVVEFQTQDGEKADKRLAELQRAPIGFDVGGGRVYLDSTEVGNDPASIELRSEAVSNGIRKAIMTHYKFIFFPVLIIGVMAFIATTLVHWREVLSNMCYILALMSWMLVVLRTALLILIDVTSFHALQGFYLAPAYFFLVCGAVFSCAAGLQLFNVAPDGEAHAHTVQSKS